MLGEYLVFIGIAGLAVIAILSIITDALFYFFDDKMVNIGDVYVNIYDEKNPFIHQERFAKIIDKEYDENGNLWVKYEYFVKKADADMYDTHIYHDKYRDFLETHRLEKLNNE